MERLAQDNADQRQTITEVICAYLRMPYTPPGGQPGPDVDEQTHVLFEARRQEHEVRLTAQRILHRHLLASDHNRYWSEGVTVDLAGAALIGSDLIGANLTEANLTEANLARADLIGANLARANLTDANLTDANLARADLFRANLTRANLTRANLTGANLAATDLTKVRGLPDKIDIEHEIGDNT